MVKQNKAQDVTQTVGEIVEMLSEAHRLLAKAQFRAASEPTLRAQKGDRSSYSYGRKNLENTLYGVTELIEGAISAAMDAVKPETVPEEADAE